MPEKIPDELSDLSDQICDAHARDDIDILIDLYAKVGKCFLDEDQINKACFYYTQAMVLALETGDLRAADYNNILVRNGRNRA